MKRVTSSRRRLGERLTDGWRFYGIPATCEDFLTGGLAVLLPGYRLGTRTSFSRTVRVAACDCACQMRTFLVLEARMCKAGFPFIVVLDVMGLLGMCGC